MMNREDEVVTLRAQVGILSEHVGRMIHVISAYNQRGWDTEQAQAKLEILENLMWKLHSRHVKLRAGIEHKADKPLLH
jgi:hypothetical protein